MATQSDKRILVVEDDLAVREVIVEGLREAGYILEVAGDAQEAQRKISAFAPHLVLTDHDMPGLTGLQLLKELRSQQNYVTVIFVSGRSDTEVVVQALKAGADDYIRKPFRFNELLARIEVSLRNNDIHRELLEANEKLKDLVDRDYLTGLYNMRSMYERIDFELKRARRFKRPIAAVMMDMDHFKTVNDNHDHLFGSFVLKEVGRLTQECMREIDFAARYGGDEFLMILTEVKSGGSEIFCERIRNRVSQHLFKDGKDEIRLTVSLGFAITTGVNNVDARRLVREADHNLYKAKDNGRNCFYGVNLDSLA